MKVSLMKKLVAAACMVAFSMSSVAFACEGKDGGDDGGDEAIVACGDKGDDDEGESVTVA